MRLQSLMSDYILVDNDIVQFNYDFAPADVNVMDGIIEASGEPLLNGKKICIDGDQDSVFVPGCVYTVGLHTIIGFGTLRICSLSPHQKAEKLKSNNRSVLLKGTTFEASFSVIIPALMPPPVSTPDPIAIYYGTGSFDTTNDKWKAT